MDAQLRVRLTEDEYLALEEKSDEKHEYVNGEMIAMAGGDPVHAYLASNVNFALVAALRAASRPCRVFTSDLRVSVFSTRLYTYPDITVVCGQPERHPKSKTTIINPTLVVEVLSPSTESWDRGGKFAHYRKAPSLLEYVMVSLETRTVEHYVRQPDESWVLRAVEGEGEVALPCLGITIRVEDVFFDVDAVITA